MPAVRAESPIVRPHGDAETRRDRFLTEGEVTRPLDEILQEEIVRALLAIAQLELLAIELHSHFTADVDLGFGTPFTLH
jgi:hypothetical protein